MEPERFRLEGCKDSKTIWAASLEFSNVLAGVAAGSQFVTLSSMWRRNTRGGRLVLAYAHRRGISA